MVAAKNGRREPGNCCVDSSFRFCSQGKLRNEYGICKGLRRLLKPFLLFVSIFVLSGRENSVFVD